MILKHIIKIITTHLLLILSINNASTTIASSPNSCDQSCGNNRTGPIHQVPYPFGFSEGCKIRLNCSDSGNILIGEFQVSTINTDTQTISVSVPGTCDRPIESIQPLFNKNYAPALHNNLLLRNCTGGQYSLVQPQPACMVPTELAGSQFSTSANCGFYGNIRCFTWVVPNGRIEVMILRYEDIVKTECRGFFSSFAALSWTATSVSLEALTVRLVWWFEGPCKCSKNANCTEIRLADGSYIGYQCVCMKGFVGDGYFDGVGCRRQVGSKGKKQLVIIVISVVVSVGVLLGVLGVTLRAWKKKKQNKFQGELRRDKKDLELPFFDLDTIANATNSFSVGNMLGQGGFGPVFKGILKDGQEIAVKRLSKNSRQGVKEFKNEVKYISKLNHRNLVRLLGCCVQGEEKMLVYEYMSNKSLDFFIFDDTRNMLLDWHKRYLIIDGIARGLMYLHQDSRLRVVHRDIKAANILLDNELNPKISDFGMARSFGGNTTEANTSKVAGTHGYISPEYAVQGLYSVKSDVFSFGVLVLEIITGQRNRGVDHHGRDLLGHAWTLHGEGKSLELIDKSIEASSNLSEVCRSVHVGLLCVQKYAEDRPSMSSVVLMLGSEGVLPLPQQPGFFVGMNDIEAASLPIVQCSANEATLSLLEAR